MDMNMKKYVLIVMMMGVVMSVAAQQEAPNIRHGNRDYNKEDYTNAEVDYRRGLEKNSHSFEAHYNLGNALFKQNKYPEAAEEFTKAAQYIDVKDKPTQAAQTYHNLGNAYFAQQQYDKAVAAYQQSLRANPKDNDTRYNMVKAMQLLEQQQQQQNQNENEDQNKDQNKQQQQQQQQQQQDENENEDQNENQNENQQQEQQMDKETAEQILQALEQDEQETQDKLQRVQGQSKRVEKEW